MSELSVNVSTKSNMHSGRGVLSDRWPWWCDGRWVCFLSPLILNRETLSGLVLRHMPYQLDMKWHWHSHPLIKTLWVCSWIQMKYVSSTDEKTRPWEIQCVLSALEFALQRSKQRYCRVKTWTHIKCSTSLLFLLCWVYIIACKT